MRKVVVSQFMTLDGVIEAPHEWSFPYWNDEIAKFKQAELFASSALLLGRVTYEGFASVWPSRTDEAGYADRINSLPKYVASKTLDKVEWNSTLIKGDLAAQIDKYKQQPSDASEHILVFGSGKLVESLIQLNLVDQYQLLVYPLILGKGQRLFPDGLDQKALKLTNTKSYASGVVLLTYESAPSK